MLRIGDKMSAKCALELLENNGMIDKTVVIETVKVGYELVSEIDFTLASEKTIDLPLTFIRVKQEDIEFQDRFIELMESRGYEVPMFNTASGYYCKKKDIDIIIEELIRYVNEEKFYLEFNKENMRNIVYEIEKRSNGRFTPIIATTDVMFKMKDNYRIKKRIEKEEKEKQNALDFLEKVFK